MWLICLIALALLVLSLFFHQTIKKISTFTTLQNAFEVRRTLVASGKLEELAASLDQAVVVIPAGEFLRGSDAYRWDERPEKAIFLDAFQIDQYEVTSAQYRRFLLASGVKPPPYWNGLDYPSGQADYPVVGVSWEQAGDYCQWAGKRLPTEAELEKACRGPHGRLYPWENSWHPTWANLDPLAGTSIKNAIHQQGHVNVWDEAWAILHTMTAGQSTRGLRPAGAYSEGASFHGILDMAGNASEWVADWYNFMDYSRLADHNPFTAGPEWNHALRGSAWYDPNGSTAWQEDQSRCSARNSSHTPVDPRVGFRCAQDAD